MTPTPEERERGYRAAAVLVEQLLESAENKRPKCVASGYQNRVLYRQGYYDGLLAAHCLHTLGEHPLVPQNANTIMNALRDQDAEQARKKT